jgi:hypothetical protein
MEKILAGLAEEIKMILVEENFFEPTMFWLNQNELLMAKPLLDTGDDIHEQLSKNAWFAGVLAKKLKADSIVLAVNGAYRDIDAKDAQSVVYDITEDPTTYPKNMRVEVILLLGINLPSGEKTSMALPYKGGEELPVEFIPEEPLSIIDGLKDDDDLISQLSDVAKVGWEVSDTVPIDEDL